MGLYLCVFDGDEEISGVEIGSYGDFGHFRDTIRDLLEGGLAGSRFPTLMLHSDSDGRWSAREASILLTELNEIAEELHDLAPRPFLSGWQKELAAELNIEMDTLYDCFFDVDGEPLVIQMQDLCRTAVEQNLPILFQ